MVAGLPMVDAKPDALLDLDSPHCQRVYARLALQTNTPMALVHARAVQRWVTVMVLVA